MMDHATLPSPPFTVLLISGNSDTTTDAVSSSSAPMGRQSARFRRSFMSHRDSGYEKKMDVFPKIAWMSGGVR